MPAVSTHVLDAVAGGPAAGVPVVLTTAAGRELARGRTDRDGRCPGLGPEQLPAGDYRLVFGTGEWFRDAGRPAFYPRVAVDFTVAVPLEGEPAHYHVPLLLSPFAYSTYRGS